MLIFLHGTSLSMIRVFPQLVMTSISVIKNTNIIVKCEVVCKSVSCWVQVHVT